MWDWHIEVSFGGIIRLFAFTWTPNPIKLDCSFQSGEKGKFSLDCLLLHYLYIVFYLWELDVNSVVKFFSSVLVLFLNLIPLVLIFNFVDLHLPSESIPLAHLWLILRLKCEDRWLIQGLTRTEKLLIFFPDLFRLINEHWFILSSLL